MKTKRVKVVYDAGMYTVIDTKTNEELLETTSIVWLVFAKFVNRWRTQTMWWTYEVYDKNGYVGTHCMFIINAIITVRMLRKNGYTVQYVQSKEDQQ